MAETVELVLHEYPLFRDLSEVHAKSISVLAENVEFPEQYYILREGEVANYFYAIRDGRVSIELFVPNRGATTIQTVDNGDVLGWSWMVPPYRWRFDARTLRRTHALAFDVNRLRRKLEEDHHLGYEMMKRFADVIVARLDAARVQLMDLYSAHA